MSRLESSIRQGAGAGEVRCPDVVWGVRVTRARTTKLLCGGSLGLGGEGEVCSLDLSSRGYCGQVALQMSSVDTISNNAPDFHLLPGGGQPPLPRQAGPRLLRAETGVRRPLHRGDKGTHNIYLYIYLSFYLFIYLSI